MSASSVGQLIAQIRADRPRLMRALAEATIPIVATGLRSQPVTGVPGA